MLIRGPRGECGLEVFHNAISAVSASEVLDNDLSGQVDRSLPARGPPEARIEPTDTSANLAAFPSEHRGRSTEVHAYVWAISGWSCSARLRRLSVVDAVLTSPKVIDERNRMRAGIGRSSTADLTIAKAWE